MQNFFKLIKKRAALLSPLLCNYAMAVCPEAFGIVGGSDVTPFAYFLQPDGTFSDQLLPSLGVGSVNSVAMNGASTGLIGGVASGGGFAYYAYPSGALSPQLLPAGVNAVNSVSLNDLGTALVGGVTSGTASAYLISPTFSVSSLGPLPTGEINSVAINILGAGLIGGDDGSNAIAYVVFPGGTLSAQLLSIVGGQTNSVAINPSSFGVLGGTDGTNAFAYLVSPAGTLSSQLLTDLGAVNSVAINASGVSLVGGNSAGGNAFAYFVDPSGALSSQLLPTFPAGSITSVAINDAQTGLIGGSQGLYPLLYMVQPDGTLSPQLLPILLGGTVNQVAINAFDAGLAVGNDGSSTFAYLISPSGSIVAMYPSLSGQMNTGTMIQALSQVNTVCLGGNNLTMAKYINKYAPEKAYYFLPALVDGTLSHALESVAPTRNTASLITADNNLFLLNQQLSRHLRDQQHVHRHRWGQQNKNTAANEKSPSGELLASAAWPSSGAAMKKTESGILPYTLWTEVIGALSYQKAEHHTPGFDPITGGLVLAMEAQLNRQSLIGGGAAYTYTHIHQHRGSGYSNIDQEYLFFYGQKNIRHMYLDAALWGGLFHIHQVRKIHMTGFDFRSTSDPRGWQLSPHLELGGDFFPWDSWLTIEPFAMIDWTNAWQQNYQEEGSGPFNMGQKHSYSSFLRTELGIRLYEAITFKSWRLTFQEKAAYVNKKPFDVGKMNAFLVGSPGSFTVETFSTVQNLGLAELAMIFEPLDLSYPYVTIAYQGEFSDAYQAHQGLFEFCWNF